MSNIARMSIDEIDKQIEKLSTKAHLLQIKHKEEMDKINTEISNLMRQKLRNKNKEGIMNE